MAETMKAWQYSSAHGGLEKNLVLAETPKPGPVGDTELLIEVISAKINPADYKLPEMGLIAKAIVRTPATPGLDFCGRVAAAGAKVDSFRIGETVFGKLDFVQHGTLSQFIVAKAGVCAPLPAGVDPDDAVCLGTGALTPYQGIAPNVKAGDRVFINGGAGGTGTFAIQIAKALGCHVTASCSGPKADLCRRLGADEVIDYKTTSVTETLKRGGPVFALALDLVGSPLDLYKAADEYLLPEGKFVQVGEEMGVVGVGRTLVRSLRPAFLGGGRRKYEFLMVKATTEDLTTLAKWLQGGTIKAVIEEAVELEEVPRAYVTLKKGRVTGNIVVHVANK